MKVTCWGTRGSIATPGPETARYGGNTTCIDVLLDSGTRLIFDAGTGIRRLGHILMQRGVPVDLSLYITHAHWDHIQGFPFFGPAYAPGNRLSIYGCPQSEQRIAESIVDQMQSIHFPVNFNAMQADITFHDFNTQTIRNPEVKVTCAPINHPGGGVGYRLEEDDKTLVFVPDNDLTPSDSDPVFTRFVDFCQGADLLMHDSQFTPEEYAKFPTWGHSDYTRTARLAVAAGVKRLALFHHDPEHSDLMVDEMVDNARAVIRAAGARIECFGAKENETLVL